MTTLAISSSQKLLPLSAHSRSAAPAATISHTMMRVSRRRASARSSPSLSDAGAACVFAAMLRL